MSLRDLLTSSRDLVQKPGEENRGLVKRSVADLAQRSLTETHHKDLDEGNLHIISCTGPLTYIYAKGTLHSSFYRDPVKEILNTILYRDIRDLHKRKGAESTVASHHHVPCSTLWGLLLG